jgi:hypothetical protein
MRKALPLTIDFSHACGVLIHEIDGASSCDSPFS